MEKIKLMIPYTKRIGDLNKLKSLETLKTLGYIDDEKYLIGDDDLRVKDPLTDKEIAAFGSDYAINFQFIDRDAKTIAVENGIIKLHDAGTGFMMIKRDAILKMIKAYPDLKYNNDVQINNANGLSDKFYALFDTMIDPKDRRYLSEDYTFCRRWQDMGGDIWLDPSISLNHYGHFCFQGNPQAIIQFGEGEKPQPPKEDIKVLELPDEVDQPA